jgi:hypothetical protein
MKKHYYKLIWVMILLVGLGLACDTFPAIRDDYSSVRGTAEAIATQAEKIITQAEGFATQIGDSPAVGTAKALATEYGPSFIATGQALATQAAKEGYLQTAEALVTQGSNELLPTLQAFATQSLYPGPPPEDIPILSEELVTNLFTNSKIVTYTASSDLVSVIDFYKTAMPAQDWIDVSDSNAVTEIAAVLKFFKPDRVATITLSSTPIPKQTIIMITIRTVESK